LHNDKYGELWPYAHIAGDKSDLIQYPKYLPDPNDSSLAVIATDVIRHMSVGYSDHYFDQLIYEPLLDFLHQKGYQEYQVNNDPARRTEAGCAINDPNNAHANLFVFAYDWRKNNVETAQALKEYVKCISKFFPNRKVNILTHSMGGLVARRYILDNLNDNNVNALITIAAPWLGAPKSLYETETGDLELGLLGLKQDTLVANQYTVKKITRSSASGYQLLPSKAYFDLGGGPVWVENGWDINGNKKTNDKFDYPTYLSLLDSRYQCTAEDGCNDSSTKQLFMPGTIGAAFHQGLQDDWRNDTTGIQYYHLYGVTSEVRTISQVKMTLRINRVHDAEGGCCVEISQQIVDYSYTSGDNTVPCRSATRYSQGCELSGTNVLSGTNYNAANAKLFPFNGNDAAADHTNITKNPKVHQKVLELLRQSVMPAARRSQDIMAQQATAEPLPLVEDAYYLRIFESDNIVVSDEWGNNTAQIPNTDLQEVVPNVTTYILGEHAQELILPTNQLLTVTFKTLTRSVTIELEKGDAITATQVIRYLDKDIPPNVTAMLLFNEQGVATLQYDSNGDNIFESTVQPTVNVNGTTPLDITEPTVTIEANSANLVTVKAVDSESGIKTVYYSLDGTNFQPYTQPVPVTSSEDSTFYAFADDNMANRSSLASYDLTGISTGHIYLPLIIKASQDSSTNQPIVK
jgi:hypothetical protein